MFTEQSAKDRQTKGGQLCIRDTEGSIRPRRPAAIPSSLEICVKVTQLLKAVSPLRGGPGRRHQNGSGGTPLARMQKPHSWICSHSTLRLNFWAWSPDGRGPFCFPCTVPFSERWRPSLSQGLENSEAPGGWKQLQNLFLFPSLEHSVQNEESYFVRAHLSVSSGRWKLKMVGIFWENESGLQSLSDKHRLPLDVTRGVIAPKRDT